MQNVPHFYTQTALALGMRKLFLQLEQQLGLDRPLAVYLAGGMAMHLYTGSRVTTDVDAEFAARILLPSDLAVEFKQDDGSQQVVYLDANYNSTFALLHEDYLQDALSVDLGLQYLQLFVLAPVDLAVSKIARFAENDRDDIVQLVRLGLTTAEAIEARARSALVGYIGNQAMLLANLRDAIKLAHDQHAGVL
jgi:hypothetical protein